MDLWTAVLFLCGLFLLIFGAEVLVRGASKLALALGITPLVVGQTVVAYGTSAPELAISFSATATDSPDLAIGNVVGSNISNILLVLGIAAMVRPLIVSRHLLQVSVPIMILVSGLVPVLVWDEEISRGEGIFLLVAAVLYSGYCIRESRRETKALEAELGSAPRRIWWWSAQLQLAMVVAGLVCLALGAKWMVDGAVQVAEALQVSELVIGLTIVAVGTSLPEIATSVLASLRGVSDIALGNAVGSNVFNVLLVLGACATFSPAGLHVENPAALRFDIPVMIAVAVACLPIFFTGMKIVRWEALLFLAYYAAYVSYLILLATQHDALGPFSTILFTYLAPLTAVTLIALAWRHHRQSVAAGQ